jgi:hypothetical protein
VHDGGSPGPVARRGQIALATLAWRRIQGQVTGAIGRTGTDDAARSTPA